MAAWNQRELIYVIVMRELTQRFRGSVLGWLWVALTPLVLLATYTIIFSGPVKVSSTPEQSGVASYALHIFCALVIFNLFTELALRAPTLLHDNAWFVKKTIFPCEILAWIALFRALVFASISFGLLIVFTVAFTGRLPWTVLLVPIVIAPFCLLLLGWTWFLSAIGSLIRDVFHVVASILPVLLFVSPVFFTMDDVAPTKRIFMYLNPMSGFIEMMRDVILRGVIPDATMYLASTAGAALTFWVGHTVFIRYRGILVDVI